MSRLLLLAYMIAFAATASASPAEAARVAHADALKLEALDRAAKTNNRYFYRYVWWPESWQKDAALLTKTQQSLLSDQGKFAAPVHVGSGVYRLDARESGWDRFRGNDRLTGLQVWEKFAGLDFVFRNNWKFVEKATVRIYYPPGAYEGKEFKYPSKEDVEKNPGDLLPRPADWANPATDAAGGELRAQDELRRILFSEAPIVFGPFWLIRSMRQIDVNNTQSGVGYYDFLNIKNRNDYFKLIGLDEKTAIRTFSEWRAIVDKSGISEQNRQVILLRGSTGYVWGTLDTFTEAGRGVARRNLRRGEFAHNAEEWIAHLPSGLPVNGLFDNQGVVAESAPDKIGPDDSALNKSRDMRVHANISCWRCHGGNKDFVRPFDDWARKTFRKNKAILRDPDRKVELELESNYLRGLERQLTNDRSEYAAAVAALTSKGEKDPGMTMAEFTAWYCGMWNRYVADSVTVEIAAEELGVKKQDLLDGLRKYEQGRGAGDNVLGEFLEEPPGTIRRLSWESSYAFAQYVSRGIQPPENIEKVKAFDSSVKEAGKPKEDAKKGEGP